RRAVRAVRRGVVQVPGARLVQEVLVEQRADRADVDDVRMERTVIETLLEERVDHRAMTPLHDAEQIVLRDFAHEAHAARAHDAAVAVVENVPAEVVLAEDDLRVEQTAVLWTFRVHEVLQPALARLVADRTVERMVDQVELERALARLERALALGQDVVAFRDRRDARRLQLGRALDLDQAHAAHRRRRKPGMVAVVRDPDAGLLGGLDDTRPLRDGHFDAVDAAGYAVRLLVRHRLTPSAHRSALHAACAPCTRRGTSQSNWRPVP